MLEEKIFSIHEKTTVVILPEMFNTGFCMHPELFAETMDGETVLWMKKIAAQKKIILVGSLMIAENNTYYNRLIWMLPNGQMGVYDKKHLFAYAGEDQHFSAGEKRLIASVNGWRINLQICYDLRFPVWSRQGKNAETPGGPEYDVLVYIASWPERRSHAWKTLLQARAIENQCYCIGLNRVGTDGNDLHYSGDSMVVDSLGEILYHRQHKEEVHTITLYKEHINEVRTKMPFWKDADPFFLVSDPQQ